jgi:hypothetical protein
VELVQSVLQLLVDVGNVGLILLQLAAQWWVLIVWLAWWTFGVNWKRAWPALAEGGWAPLVLLMIISAFVWSRLDARTCECLGFTSVPNFWWQLGDVGLLAAVTFFCGWLQGYFGWTPQEVDLDPPALAAHGHDHGHH